MNFLQLWGDEQQRGIDAWFENLLRETANLSERQACDAFGFLLHAGSPADAWYEDLHDDTRLRWPSLILAFTSAWPVSNKLLCASGALHARRMERKEEQARVRDEEVLRAVEQELQWATEEEDYMWWAYLEEKKRLALDARREAALEEDWAEFEEWERSVQVMCVEDKRAERECKAQQIAREGKDLEWRAAEERLEESWTAEMATLEVEGRRMVEEMTAARVRRVEGILRVVAEVEDRRQEATTRQTIAHCVRQPPCTTSTTSTTPTLLAPPPNTTTGHSPPLEIVATDVVEPTVKKPPDGLSLESATSDASRETAETGRAVSGQEGIVEGRVPNAYGLAYHPLCKSPIIDNRLREVVILPLTKHPTTTSSTTPVVRASAPSWVVRLVCSFLLNEFPIAVQPVHDDYRSLATKHPTEPVVHASLDHDQARSPSTTDSRNVILSPTTGDRPAPTKHPTALSAAASITIPRTTSSGHDPTGTSPIVKQLLDDDDHPAPTKHPTACEYASLIVIASTAAPCVHDGTRLTDFVQPPADDNRPALTKHPTTRANATLVAIASTVSLFAHAITRSARFVQRPPNDRPQAVKQPTASSWTALVVNTRPPWFTGGLMAIIALTGEHELTLDRPALTKHPTTLNKALSMATPPTPSSTNSLTRSLDFAQPLASDDRPTPTKHPATRSSYSAEFHVAIWLPQDVERPPVIKHPTSTDLHFSVCSWRVAI
ncbi:hypothetical protein BOTBODRAFT_188954 [Botryobasidium botryosum FD-172 SS1]|uniref:Uncharacterized protein n=1 Tax=Botryobasidium botryosum (strain FD-172 SS1) TaxID=930990 RepID=A0A067MLA2_BOTB1|nr:hypothetical protein BOTBODRAFT_188954 [Botryobasidium botryosum FD-172 SS1]